MVLHRRQMPRYKKADFDDEEVSDASNFPTDVTITGIGNPNLSASGQQLAAAQEQSQQKMSNSPGVSFLSPMGSARMSRRRSFWDRSSPFEKLLLIVIGCLSCVIIILISVLAAQSNTTLQVHVNTQNKSKSYICLSNWVTDEPDPQASTVWHRRAWPWPVPSSTRLTRVSTHVLTFTNIRAAVGLKPTPFQTASQYGAHSASCGKKTNWSWRTC